MATHERRVVFFDLDGTLHQQDMFGSFLRYLLRRQPLNALLVLPLLPIIAIALLIPRFYVSTSKSIIKALINMHSFEIQLSPIG